MAVVYQDRWIVCTEHKITVRGYYFPWGTKHIRYADIRAVRRAAVAALRGRGRIWGTANLGYWASLDPNRPRKSTALILDVGRRVKPFLTPDDPAAVAQALLEHTSIGQIVDYSGPLL